MFVFLEITIVLLTSSAAACWLPLPSWLFFSCEQDLVLAPRFHWRLFLQPKLKELVQKYPHRKLESDDTSVVVSATRQKGLTLTFDGTDIDWTSIKKQLFDWGDLSLAGKKLRLVISFNYMENAPASTVSGRTIAHETLRLLSSGCFKNETDRSMLKKEVYTLKRFPGSY